MNKQEEFLEEQFIKQIFNVDKGTENYTDLVLKYKDSLLKGNEILKEKMKELKNIKKVYKKKIRKKNKKSFGKNK